MVGNVLSLRFKKLGPLEDGGELKNTNITMLYGYPNTGKSFILRSFYGLLSLNDRMMYKRISRYIEIKLREKITDVFEKDLSVTVGKLLNIYEVPRIIYKELVHAPLPTLSPSGFIPLIKAIYSEIFPDQRLSYSEGKITAEFEQVISLKIGRLDIGETLRSGLFEFISTMIGIDSLNDFLVNGKNFKQSVSDDIDSIDYGTGRVVLENRAVEWMNRRGFVGREIDANVDAVAYEFLEVADHEMKVKVSGTFTFDTDYFIRSLVKIKEPLRDTIPDDEDYSENKKLKQKVIRAFEKIHRGELANPPYVLRILPGTIVSDISSKMVGLMLEHIRTLIQTVASVREVRFVPFGRTPLIQLANNANPYRDVAFEDNVPYNSSSAIYSVFQSWVSLAGRSLIKFLPQESMKLDPFLPLQGSISFDEGTRSMLYKDFKNKTVSMNYASAMTTEVSGLFLSYLSMDSRGLLVIEEPEAQLHPLAQITMALTLFALSSLGFRLIFSTHSDLFGQIFFHLVKFKPSKKEIVNLIKIALPRQIVESQTDKINQFAQYISDGINKVIINAYFVDYDGKIAEKDILSFGMEIPGITNEALLKVFQWSSEISQGKN